jgi:type II secretory pathway pseudopilin PulG
MSETPVPSQARAGFTLLHLALLLALLSVGAAVAIPRFFDRDIVTLENGAVLLARDLRAAQNRAAYSREPLFLRFFGDGDGYEVIAKSGNPIKDPRTGHPFVRHYSSDGVFEGLRITSIEAGDDNTIVLSALGETSDRLIIELSFGGNTRTLRSARSTGLTVIDGTTSGFLDDGL